MKKLLITIALLLTFTLANCQLGIIASQDVPASAPSGNMISNGTFDSSTGWSEYGGCSIGSGVCTFDDVDDGDFKQSDANMVSSIAVSTAYTLTFDLSGTTGDGIYFKIQNEDGFVEYKAYGQYTNGTDKTIGFTTPDDVDGGGIKFVCSTLGESGGSFDNLVLEAD